MSSGTSTSARSRGCWSSSWAEAASGRAAPPRGGSAAAEQRPEHAPDDLLAGPRGQDLAAGPDRRLHLARLALLGRDPLPLQRRLLAGLGLPLPLGHPLGRRDLACLALDL